MKKFFLGFKYAASGLSLVIKNEVNFRVHIVMAIYVIFFGIIGRVSSTEFAVLCALIALVMSLELINTALEVTADRITKEKDNAIRKIKDLSAGAVLISAIFAAVAGLHIFLQQQVLDTVFTLFGNEPAVLIGFLISIPIALFFMFYQKKSEQ